MSYQLTDRARALANQTEIEPNLVLYSYKADKYFSIDSVIAPIAVGDVGLFVDGSWLIGGDTESKRVKKYISLEGTTTNIQQQLDLDKSNASSTMTIKVRLVDINQEITKLISPGFLLTDLLYSDAIIYLGFKQGHFPDDYIDLFIGKIQTIESGSGYIELTIAHPEELKRTEIFQKFETELTQNADYYSKTIQDITYYQSATYTGIVEVRYVSVIAYGDKASISVSGNLITVTIETGVTKAKTICDAINNNSITSKMVLARISGTDTNTQVTQAITSLEVDSEIFVDNVDGFYLPESPIFRTYIRINDEIIEYTGIDTVNKKLTGCVRKSLDSIGQFHEIEDTVTSFYKLGDNTDTSNAIDLTLKMMLSDGVGGSYISGIKDLRFYNFGGATNYPSSFLVKNKNMMRLYNVQVGDFCTITNASDVANNEADLVIEDIYLTSQGTVITLTGATFNPENMSNAECAFKSQYNVLPDGFGYIPSQVDIDRFNLIKNRFPGQIINYEFYLKETVDGKNFINKELFLPSALYSIPRQGKVSVGISAPPLYDGGSKILSSETVKNPTKIKVTRTINKFFYNSIVFKYNQDSLEDKMLAGAVVYSADSQNRINAPNKPYTIVAKGLRESALNTAIITKNCKRLLERYQFAAELIPVEPDYKTGLTIEVGDTVIFGDEDLKISDTINATRDFKPRIFEVVNKDFNWKTGSIKLQIVDTKYLSNVRYGLWAPSSVIGSGSNQTVISITNSYGSVNEAAKWEIYKNRSVRIRSPDYTVEYLTKIIGFVEDDNNKIVVESVPVAPLAGYILDLPNYNDMNLGNDSLYKEINVFIDPTLFVITGVSSKEFTVSVGDAAKLFVNASIRIHSNDYSVDSKDSLVRVLEIVGTTVKTTEIGFTPSAGQKIDLVGFAIDEGQPYVWL